MASSLEQGEVQLSLSAGDLTVSAECHGVYERDNYELITWIYKVARQEMKIQKSTLQLTLKQQESYGLTPSRVRNLCLTCDSLKT